MEKKKLVRFMPTKLSYYPLDTEYAGKFFIKEFDTSWYAN